MRHSTRSDGYRASAIECAALAEVVENPRTKAALLIMAEAWLRLADHVDQQPCDEPGDPTRVRSDGEAER